MAHEAKTGTRVEHDCYGEGIVSKVNTVNYEIFFERSGKMEILKSSDELSIIDDSNASEDTSGNNVGALSVKDLEIMLTHVLDNYGLLNDIVPLGSKWTGGKLIMQPGNTTMQSKEIPIEAFFHKIVMLRDRLRVLEQHINSNQKLTDEEKIDLQQYITRIYGSLTTFNALFREKEHNFVGTGKD